MRDLVSRQAAIDALYAEFEYVYCYNCDHKKNEEWCEDCHRKYMKWSASRNTIERVLNALPSAQPGQRWIPVTEKLPEDEYVLISKKPTKLSGSKWCVTVAIRMADPRSGKIQWRDSGFGIIQDDEVLAWMPLPEPYRKEGEADGEGT